MDFFSLLADHLIISIISLLPIHEAGRTSILGRRWRHLWTCITEFGIVADHRFPAELNKQVDTIMSRPQLKIVKFSMVTCPSGAHHSLLARWAEELVRRGVSELGLINLGQVFSAPPCVFSSKSLTVLKLRFCKLDSGCDSPVVACTNLRSLELEAVTVSDTTIRQLVSKCERLESLVVDYCSLYEVVVRHKRLLRLHLRSRVCRDVVIETPALVELELDVPSDVKAIRLSAPKIRSSSVDLTINIGASLGQVIMSE